MENVREGSALQQSCPIGVQMEANSVHIFKAAERLQCIDLAYWLRRCTSANDFECKRFVTAILEWFISNLWWQQLICANSAMFTLFRKCTIIKITKRESQNWLRKLDICVEHEKVMFDWRRSGHFLVDCSSQVQYDLCLQARVHSAERATTNPPKWQGLLLTWIIYQCISSTKH